MASEQVNKPWSEIIPGRLEGKGGRFSLALPYLGPSQSPPGTQQSGQRSPRESLARTELTQGCFSPAQFPHRLHLCVFRQIRSAEHEPSRIISAQTGIYLKSVRAAATNIQSFSPLLPQFPVQAGKIKSKFQRRIAVELWSFSARKDNPKVLPSFCRVILQWLQRQETPLHLETAGHSWGKWLKETHFPKNWEFSRHRAWQSARNIWIKLSGMHRVGFWGVSAGIGVGFDDP